MPQIPRLTGPITDPRRLVLLVVLLAAAAAALFLAVGRPATDSDARNLIEQALGGEGDKKLRSGRVDASLAVSLRGVPEQVASPGGLTMKGVFEDAGRGRLPKLDFDVTVSAVGRSFQMGMVSTGRRMYVSFQGRHYEVPRRQLSSFVGRGRAESGSAAALLAGLGVNPGSWIENEREEGSATVGGVETTHVSADVDVDRAMQDLVKLASEAPGNFSVGRREVPQEAIATLEDAVSDAHLDLYVGKEDRLLRRAQAQMALSASAPQGGGTVEGDVTMDLTLSDVNEPQQVRAPSQARPIRELRGDVLGLSSLLGAPVAGGRSEPAPAPRTEKPSRAARGDAAARTGDPKADAYLNCVGDARTSAALQQCASLLD